MEENERQEFSQWLQRKVKANDENEFESMLEEMGDEKIQDYYNEFRTAKSRSFKLGGVLEYVKCLQKKMLFNKKGGKMVVDCGCGKKMAKGNKMASGGIIKEGTSMEKKSDHDIKEGSRIKPKSGRKDSNKTKTEVKLPSMNTKMPNPNSKQMMQKGGSMLKEKQADLSVPKGLKEPDNKQKKVGIKERKYLKK